MKYIKSIYEDSIPRHDKFFWLIPSKRDGLSSIEIIKKSANVVPNNYLNTLITMGLNDKFLQSYFYINYNSEGKNVYDRSWGWMPLIYENKDPKHSIKFYKTGGFIFKGYVNCTKKEVDEYIKYFLVMNSYNL